MGNSAERLQSFKEIESQFEIVKKRFLKMAINQFLNGKISLETFCNYLSRGELTDLFKRDYVAVIIPDNPLIQAISKP
jgi:hypothetical protein